MKKLFYLLLLVLTGSNTIQAQQIIENPTYDFRDQGIRKITKIELMPDSTRLHMRCTYPHNWWTSIGRDITIKTSNDTETYPIISVKGTEFDKQSFTPEWGYQDFILTFAPIKQETKEIDLIADKWNILGIKLTEQAKEKKSSFPESIRGNWSDISGEKGWTYGFYPSFAIIGHQFWTYSKIKKTRKGYQLSLQCDDKTKELYITQKDTLLAIGESKKEQQLYTLGRDVLAPNEMKDPQINPFQSGEMVLQGFIEGYHPKADFKTSLVYVKDVINNTDIKSLIEIQPDGRFSTKLNLAHAGSFFFSIADHPISFIGVPNDTLTIYLNWEGLKEKDCHPNVSYYDYGHSRYMGKYGRLYNDIHTYAQYTIYNYRKHAQNSKLDFQTFHKEMMKVFRQDSIKLEEQLTSNNILPLAKKISRLTLITAYTNGFFEYTMKLPKDKFFRGEKYSKQYADCSAIPENFFDLLKYIDVSDPTITLTPVFSTLMNRYEYAPFLGFYSLTYKTEDLLDYLNQQDKLTASEQEVLSKLKQMSTKSIQLDSIQTAQLIKDVNNLIQKYQTEYQTEFKQYSTPFHVSATKKGWIDKDSTAKTIWSDPNNIVTQTVLCREWSRATNGLDMKYGEQLTLAAKEYITIPFLREKIDLTFKERYKSKKSTKDLEKIGEELFQKIIAPHKGKYILIDFWATWCAPCVRGIKNSHKLRTSLVDKNIAFVFITDELSSGMSEYNRIMKNVIGDKHMLSKDEYNELATKFNITTIPRYILVNTQGKIIDDKFNLSNLESKLKELGVIEK